MSDASVHSALRSDAPLVVIEAPAGCGKTHQGAEYASDLASAPAAGRPLILTHTHAARSVFAARTARGSRVEVRTIDSVIVQIAAAYHQGLSLPPDPVDWVRKNDGAYRALAVRVARLLARHPMIARALAVRHPVVICDEHQDSTGDQHAVVEALLEQGSRLRVFADPQQKIFREDSLEDSFAPCDWEGLKGRATHNEQLDHPHRWEHGCRELGKWVLQAREELRAGRAIDLRPGRGVPASVTVIVAEDTAPVHDRLQISQEERAPIDRFVRTHGGLLVLARSNDLANAMRAFFNREIQLWEGHVRDGLETLVQTMTGGDGKASILAAAVVEFMSAVGTGFTASEFGDALKQEVAEGCISRRRGKYVHVQKLARMLVDNPSHKGVSVLLKHLAALRKENVAFGGIRIDRNREFWEAVRLGGFESAEHGLAEITRRRAYTLPQMPDKVISNIHKAKGLECEHAVIMPCSKATFPNTDLSRRLLYVAISRASHKLLIVASKKNPSPLFLI